MRKIKLMDHLRPYQNEIGNAVLASVLGHKGLTFSVEIARQGGKNELSACLELGLLVMSIGDSKNIVKCSPTFRPQTMISMVRLKDRLNEAGFAGIWRSELGYIIRLGSARVVFLSADESSNVVGNTAHLLLEIDEAQDVGKDKYNKEFKPMGATNNATTVLYGTTWDEATLLEEVKQTNLELERRDGLKRHFRYDWQEVAGHNPDYRAYVERERERLGEDHPLFLTQYCLLPVRGGGGFLDAAQREQLQGEHGRLHRGESGKTYVAGIDLAGEAEEVEGEYLVRPYAGRDATGVGEPVASFLRKALGSRVVPFKFTQQSKSELGFNLLAAINSGRLKVYKGDGSAEYREFRHEMEKARSQYRPSRTMNFYVDPSHGHDDFLMSLALVVEAGREYVPRGAKGSGG